MAPSVAYERGSRRRVRSVIEAMPERVYGSLPYAARTAEACVHATEKALSTKNSRHIIDWLQYELAVPANADVLATLALAVDRVLGATKDGERLSLARRIRDEADAYVRSGFASERDEMSRARERLVAGIHLALRAIDPALVEHSVAVAAISRRLATASGGSKEQLTRVVLAANVHEIGKLHLVRGLQSVAVLLTLAERTEVRLEIRRASMFLADEPVLRDVAEIVREIYCDAPAPESVPLESRIITVADAFHTMTLARPYRQAKTVHASLAELTENRNGRFDSKVVASLVALLDYHPEVAVSA